MKNYGDLGGCYPPRPTASTENTLLDLHNYSQHTQPDSLPVKYTIFHDFVYLLFTNDIPFTYLAQKFVFLLTAGNPHCHKIGISHKCRTLSRRVRGWTSGRSLPVQIFVEYLYRISGGASSYRLSQGVPAPRAQQEIITLPDKETYMHAPVVIPHIQDLQRKPQKLKSLFSRNTKLKFQASREVKEN